MSQAAPACELPWPTSPKRDSLQMIAMEKSAALAVPRGRRRIDREELQELGPAFLASGCLGPLHHFLREKCNSEAIQCASLCPLVKASSVHEAGASARQYSFDSPLLKGVNWYDRNWLVLPDYLSDGRSCLHLCEINFQDRTIIAFAGRDRPYGGNLKWFLPIRVANNDLRDERTILLVLTMNKNGAPQFFNPVSAHSLSDAD